MYSIPETRASLLLKVQDTSDIHAWENFVELYTPVIARAARARGLQSSDVENVTQEVLIRVAKSIGHWLERSERGSFRAWLSCIARNESVRLLTRRQTQPTHQPPGSISQLSELIADQERRLNDFIELEYQREVFRWAAEQVRICVHENTWQAFWLTHVEGLSIAEASKRLGVQAGNIHFGRSRVMKRIRDLVQLHEEAQ
jgi:RNA polymerase sigma-70 factor, ECF subfamily